MLQSTKNKETLGILGRLKQKMPGADSSIPEDSLSLDMTMEPEAGDEDTDSDSSSLLLQPKYLPKTKLRKKVKPEDTGL